ncbi:MAG: Crp/Fnr family transcriptional regulator [Pseudomonadota bacterium]
MTQGSKMHGLAEVLNYPVDQAHAPSQDDAGEMERSTSAVFLSEAMSQINDGARFLERLTLEEITAVRRAASVMDVEKGENIFMQGDQHSGIFLIESGRVRTFYAGPSGREITLAYWTPGHFVGGPEVFGRGLHVWSATAMEASKLSYLPGGKIKYLAETNPGIALALIDGVVAKGKCYSALVQMLGTRSVTERLAQLLLILVEVEGRNDGTRLLVDRRITHEQLAAIVGSTRQWVTSTLARFQKKGHLHIERNTIVIENPDGLRGEI